MCFLEPESTQTKQTDLSLADIEDTCTPTGSFNSKQKETFQSQQEKIKMESGKDLLLLKDLKFKNLNTFGEEIEHHFSNASSPKFYKSRTSVKTNREIEQLVKNKKILLSKLSFKEDEFCPKIEDKNKAKILNKQASIKQKDKVQIKDEGKPKNKKFNQNLLFTQNEEINNGEEISEKNYTTSNVIILDWEIEEAKKLILEDVEGNLLCQQLLIIDASGLTQSIRKKRDGHTFFGPVETYKNTIINDFIINISTELCKTRLFVIIYDRTSMRYYFRHIKGEDNKVLIYTKITTFFQIKKKHFFSINQLAFSIEVDQNNFIIITIYDNDLKKIPQTFEFKPSDSPVSLGRHKCSVTLDYSVLSKKHCVINYDAEEKCWKICDGYAGRASTNGTWLLITSKFEIKEEATFFKVGENLFKITLS